MFVNIEYSALITVEIRYVGFLYDHFNQIVSFFKVMCHQKSFKKKAASLWILSWVNNKIIPLIKRYMDFISFQKNDTRKKHFWSKDCA
jgi:hypothetical protein